MNIMAVDPGRDKCGLAVIDGQGKVLWRQVIETGDLEKMAQERSGEFAPACLILGNGTTSKAARGRLQAALPDFMEHDTKRAARLAAEHNARMYGTTGNERPLPKRELFDNKADCYAEFTHGMLSGDALTAFCAAVDGE